MNIKIFLSTVLILLLCSISNAQEFTLYKQVDTTKLYLEIHKPPNFDSTKEYPAMVFFFGGGWNGGSRNQFIEHAKYFAQRGMVCFLADYRTKSKHQASPFDCVKDAKSAMRYIKENASVLRIDPSKIIASGGSAGGHLAAATALISDFNETSDNLGVSPIPSALVLFNPVFDNGPGGYGYERVGHTYKSFSPLHNIKPGAPPTIVFLGTNDRLVPVTTAEYYKMVMEKVKSKCELHLYEGQPHGFFNYSRIENYKKTVKSANEFLINLGYLNVEPVIPIE